MTDEYRMTVPALAWKTIARTKVTIQILSQLLQLQDSLSILLAFSLKLPEQILAIWAQQENYKADFNCQALR